MRASWLLELHRQISKYNVETVSLIDTKHLPIASRANTELVMIKISSGQFSHVQNTEQYLELRTSPQELTRTGTLKLYMGMISGL